MPRAAELKSGQVVLIDDQPHIVRQVQSQSPSARGATTLYKVRFNHAATGQKVDRSLKGDDLLPDADFQRRAVQFLYREGDELVFMDRENYSQYPLNESALTELTPFLTEDTEGLVALLVDDQCIAIQPPESVALPIVETPPAIKGASQSARTKTARLSTGLEVQVPEYLEQGETIKVNTGTRDYMSRA